MVGKLVVVVGVILCGVLGAAVAVVVLSGVLGMALVVVPGAMGVVSGFVSWGSQTPQDTRQ